MMYCIKTPGEKLLEGTASSSSHLCWEAGFGELSFRIKGFREKYWKRWDASVKEAKRRGYTIVKCKLVEAK